MQSLRDDSGLSLTELLVVSVLMLLVLGTAYMLFDTSTGMADVSEARVIASDNAQKAQELISRDLRQAQENYSGESGVRPGALAVAKPDTIEFFMDETRDGRPERIKYYMQGTSLMRASAPPIGTEYEFSHGAFGTPKVILKNIRTDNGPVFCFHEVTEDPAVTCANGEKHGFKIVTTSSPLTTLPKIAMVGINLSNEEQAGGKKSTVHTSALIRIRSVENAVE
jgi:hypothetical protein